MKGDMLGGVELDTTADAAEAAEFDVVPSELFRQHIFGCFIDEPEGAKMIEQVGVDNVMVEADYPHTDSSWPDSIEISRSQVSHLALEDQYKVLRGNPERLFRFTPATVASAR
jgi:Amidohydrolase